MNSNKGADPMLSSFVTGDSIWNTKIITDIDIPSGQFLPLTPSDPVSPAPDSMLSSPDINGSSFADLASLWSNERKRVSSVKIEEDEGFSDVGSSEMDMEDEDIIRENVSTVSDDTSALDSCDDEALSCDSGPEDFIISTELEARRYVETKFLQIAFVPNSRSNHKEKIQYILSLSDCREYSVDHVMNLDKKSSDSARVCAKIVQNIPQRYRWDCVKPEQIPCCYTIVADCKKISCRDKPPRPMNAFMIWAQGARRLINELCPKMQNAAISEALGYCWRQKPDTFKKRFEFEKVKLRRFHDVEFPAYKYKPKTKVQKAKEKEELSLSKAKLSKTATKRKQKSCDNNNILPKDTSGRRGRCGRPKKIKLSPDSKDEPKPPKSQSHNNNNNNNNNNRNNTNNTHPHTHNHHHQHQHVLPSGEPVKMLPTKPAIKDMLTLKILNDRRSKEMAIANSPPAAASAHDNIQHFLGQLSPSEAGSPHTSDNIFDELRDLDHSGSFVVRGKDPTTNNNNNSNSAGNHQQHGRRRFPSSSVYDTPASTPPVDLEENNNTTLLRLSPVQQLLHKTHQVAMLSSSSSLSLSSSSSCIAKHTTTFPVSPMSSTHQPQPQSQVLSRCSSKVSGNNNNNINNNNNNNKCLLSPRASMPSLTAILSSGPHIPVRDSQQNSLGVVIGSSSNNNSNSSRNNNCTKVLNPVLRGNIVTSTSSPLTVNTRNKSRLSSTDVILSCVSEILDKDSNKQSSDFQTNSPFLDFNNNNNNSSSFRSWECFNFDSAPGAFPGLLNPKLSSVYGTSKIFDFNDIDTLCPDLNVPLLSDDVMSSLMNTL